MENQESDIDESKILYFINNTSSNDESLRQEATQFLQWCTFKLQLIPIFENILRLCIEDQSQSNLYYCILILRDTIINRGYLYSPENHMSYIEILFSIIENAVDLVSNNIAILNVFSDAISFSYRFIFEKTNEFPKLIFDFSETSGYHKIIALSTLNSILNAFEREMPHLPDPDSVIKGFKIHLSIFFEFSFRCMSSSPSDGDDQSIFKKIHILSVELFNKTTEFATNDNRTIDKLNFPINDNYFKPSSSEDIPPSFYIIDCLFNFFNEWEPQDAIKAGQSLRSYLYLCNLIQKANNRNKADFINSILYLIYNTNQLLTVLINSPANEDFVQEGYDKRDITPLLIMISKSMELLLRRDCIHSLTPSFKFVSGGVEIEDVKGSGMNIILDFLNYCVEYTKNFILIDPNEFFIFWKIIAKSEFEESVVQSIIDNVKYIFEFYLNYLLEVNEGLEQRADDFFSFSNGGDFVHPNLWEMMRGSIVDAANLISSSVNQIVEDEKDRDPDPSFVVSYQKMIIITTLFTSIIDDFTNLNKVFSFYGQQDDFIEAIKIIFFSIYNFIIYHSGNLNDRLNIIGEFVAKAEFCFASLFNSFFYRSTQNEYHEDFRDMKKDIDRNIQAVEYKDKKIENFFIDHFIDVIKIFTPYTDLLLFILNILEKVYYHDSISFKGNKKLREIATERLQPFDLETVPFVYLQKVIPKMYKIYSSVAGADEWDQFLATFDSQFSDELISPPKCFLLFSQLYGVSMFYHNTNELILKTVEWMLDNHYEDTIKCLQIHSNDKAIVSMILKFWLKMSSLDKIDEKPRRSGINFGSPFKNKIFSDENGNGIIYFRSIVQILLLLKEQCEDSQWISMKLIHNCICGDYANYGIMEMFQDNSLDVVIENFLFLIQNWAIGENSKRLIKITQVIRMFPQIGVTTKFLFNVEENLNGVLGFLIYNLLLPNEDDNKKEVWIETCRSLYLLIVDAIIKSYPVTKFRQFFLLILDALITLPFNNDFSLSSITSSVAFLLMYYDQEFCHKVTDTVIQTFEAEYVDNVNAIFENLWKAVLSMDEGEIVKIMELKISETFLINMVEFSNQMKIYQVEIANIEEFQGIFRRAD